MKLKLVVIMMLSLSASVYAGDCTTVKEMDTADAAASKIQDWAGVSSFFKKYKQCDDGYIAEGLSHTIGTLLAKDWRTLDQLNVMTNKDKIFESWVVKHINTTADDSDLTLIVKNAKEDCPARNTHLCTTIENAARQALQDLEEE
ncbi:hypothetical protein [Siccibacter turicensis]|uniref:hypothetical protein n=1 Tax=Siccibacter turicensis TaxID=357233 RepID=UPI0004637CDA|nr:hypothetical protein [Siccibacter turicensis]